MRRALLIVFCTLGLAGCGMGVVDGPQGSPAGSAPHVVPDAPAAHNLARVRIPQLSQDGYRRRAERLTLRVRNLSCEGVAVGSAFAMTRDTLVTNRHVVAGAQELEVDTFDGRSLRVDEAGAGALGDIAFIHVTGTLPAVATTARTLSPGANVAAVGYPLGGPFTLSRGLLVDRVPGDSLGIPGPVFRVTADVQPGNSGGPLLDGRGRVVGIVYAIEVKTGFGLAIPLETASSLLTRGGLESVPVCGSG
jgi:S1-C subfamily serine protease